MLLSNLTKIFALLPLLLLPGFFLHSPTSHSAKLQIFLGLTALACHLYYTDGEKAIYSSAQSYAVSHPLKTIVCVVILGSCFKYLQQKLRFARLNAIKMKYGFTDNPKTFENMTVDQAQEVERNMAEWEFPRLWQFGWISDFLRVWLSNIPFNALADYDNRPRPTLECLARSLTLATW